MSVQIRPLTDGDFFSWLGVYEGYGEFYTTAITDEKALLVWSWIIDPKNELEGVVAVDDNERIVGLAHFHEFLRPLHAERGLYLDDLYVEPQARRHGVGRQLLEYTRALAQSRKLNVIRWITDPHNTTAQKLYNDVATRTDWVTYDLKL